MLRVETHGEITQKAGKGVADQLLAKIVKLVTATLRAEDSMGRTGEAIFTVIFGGTSSQQAIAFARRVQDQIEKAQITYRDQPLKMRASFGLAALDIDPVGSLEELMKLALQRLHQAASRAAQRIVGGVEASPAIPSIPATWNARFRWWKARTWNSSGTPRAKRCGECCLSSSPCAGV
jgi:diguanylate cyclase (GGDEF)-like protein